MSVERTEEHLDTGEQTKLLRIARDGLAHYVRTSDQLDLSGYGLTPRLREKRGAFVTLRDGEMLRGCIGYTKALEPLAETVRDNAVNAGTRDPRFPPITAGELGRLHIEISALGNGEVPGTPFIPVHEPHEIEIGRDGLYLETVEPHGGGLLLPQVPVEQRWNLEQYLEGLCRKAGVAPGAWQAPGAKLYRFEAQVFGEHDFPELRRGGEDAG